ncbi:hypothetical protein B4134_1823 [Bacillus safensis]|nr:hypothetical protein B4134_1823 [Bacillus safensis]
MIPWFVRSIDGGRHLISIIFIINQVKRDEMRCGDLMKIYLGG